MSHSHNYFFFKYRKIFIYLPYNTGYKYNKTPLYAAMLNAVLLLRDSIGISLNRTVYWYLLQMWEAIETAMHQPKAVHYLATVYIVYLFQRPFVSLSKTKIPTVFSDFAITVRTHLSSLPRLTLFLSALELIGTYR